MAEEKKTRSYSVAGKLVRRILCITTFMLLMFFFGVCVYVIAEYGIGVVSNDFDLYSCERYKNKLSLEIDNLVCSVVSHEMRKNDTELTVYDVGNSVARTYDVAKIAEGNISENIEDLDAYVTNEEEKKLNIYDYDTVKSFINTSAREYDNKYLYLDNETFANIFKKNGLQNTNCWLSNNFPEEAYIIYKSEGLMLRLKQLEKSNVAIVNSETEEQYYEYTNTDMNMDGEDCAVYDPLNDVYYSTWDDYFTPFERYVYSLSELKNNIKYSTESASISSIIFPLLWSQNRVTLFTDSVESYKQGMDYEKAANSYDDSAFKYYIRGGNGDIVYSNVEGSEDIVYDENYESYVIKNGSYDLVAPTTRIASEELWSESSVSEWLGMMEVGSVVYFGFNPNKIKFGDVSDTVSFIWGYNTFGKYIVFFIIGTIVLLILLVVQAISLIKITGKRDDSGEIKLTWFDKTTTEFWLFVYIVTVVGSAMLVFFIVNKALNKSSYDEIFILQYGTIKTRTCFDIITAMLIVVFSSLPFGIFFMEMTLSLARRIKAGNLGSKMIIINKIAARFNRKKITDKLKFLTRVYIGVQVVILAWACYVVYTGKLSILKSMIVLVVFFILVWLLTILTSKRFIRDVEKLKEGIEKITEGDLDAKVALNNKYTVFQELEDGINNISDGLKNAVEKSLKDERMKTELITNVSHDLKTPLTSIINYINLLKSEKMPTPEAEHYIEVLDQKANRLKQLTEDLVEAAKATSGNIELTMMPLSFDELMRQALGECEEKLAEKNLNIVTSLNGKAAAGPVMVMADGRRLFRVLDNILQNAYKYAMEGTRIYVDLSAEDNVVHFSMKNISKAQLNISAEELMERFTRGDSSRTTEGSGLGLSIAKDLTKLMGGTFNIELDGDLFKVVITFPEYIKPASTPSE